MNKSFAYLPPEKRKKIVLITDDIRTHSGVGTVGREIIMNTSQHFNWVNIGGAVKHPDKGKRFDLSEDTNKRTGITDASVIVYPCDGYGDANLLGYFLLKTKFVEKFQSSILIFGMITLHLYTIKLIMKVVIC